MKEKLTLYWLINGSSLQFGFLVFKVSFIVTLRFSKRTRKRGSHAVGSSSHRSGTSSRNGQSHAPPTGGAMTAAMGLFAQAHSLSADDSQNTHPTPAPPPAYPHDLSRPPGLVNGNDAFGMMQPPSAHMPGPSTGILGVLPPPLPGLQMGPRHSMLVAGNPHMMRAGVLTRVPATSTAVSTK